MIGVALKKPVKEVGMKEKMSILARLENDASAASLKGGLYSVVE